MIKFCTTSKCPDELLALWAFSARTNHEVSLIQRGSLSAWQKIHVRDLGQVFENARDYQVTSAAARSIDENFAVFRPRCQRQDREQCDAFHDGY